MVSANVLKYSFIHQVLNNERHIILVKGTQDDINSLKELGFKDFSDGKLYRDYFYVLLDKKWWLSKETGDDFLGDKKIPVCEALSSQELKSKLK